MQHTISQRGQRIELDVLVMGSGIAGLCYVLELAALKPHARIGLFSKETLLDSNTYYAQGGIAAATQEDVDAHIEDTLSAGDGLCNESAVCSILKKGYDRLEYLLQQGVPFDVHTSEGTSTLSRGQEAGHSKRRIYHVGDETGAAIAKTLVGKIKQLPNVTLYEKHTAVNLITQIKTHQPACFPEVIGAYVLDESSGNIHTFLAKTVVLATGGAGRVYRYTTNPPVATGDGVAMAYRAGARVGGLEFYQFHPTLFYHPKINHFLISEALRGEGAYLRSTKNQERFMKHYAPDTMELATRDIVARAIFSEIEQSGEDFVYLDIRHKDKTFLQNRFPMIYRTLLSAGFDLSQDLIPVVPAAHYMGGGILTDMTGRTDLSRLFAIGETAFTGLHGANRLASNSLLEGAVMGQEAARASAPFIDTPLHLYSPVEDWDSTSVLDLRRASQINVHWRGLRGEMSSYAGIIRTEAGLRDQLKLVRARRDMIEDYYWNYAITRDLIELRNIILMAELIVRSALNRRESRGGHYREDYKAPSEKAFESTLKMNDFSRIDPYE